MNMFPTKSGTACLLLVLTAGCAAPPPAPDEASATPPIAPVDPGLFPGLVVKPSPAVPRATSCADPPVLQVIGNATVPALASVAFSLVGSEPPPAADAEVFDPFAPDSYDAELHFGPAPVVSPSPGAYPYVVPVVGDPAASFGTSCAFRALAVLQPEGATYARGRTIVDGVEAWSNEVRVAGGGFATTTLEVEPPAGPEAGVLFSVAVHVNHPGAPGVLGLYLTKDRSRIFDFGSAGAFGGPDHLGGPVASFGGVSSVVLAPVFAPSPGRWYLRVSADPGNAFFGRMVPNYTPEVWSPELVIDVQPPATPNVVLYGTNVDDDCLKIVLDGMAPGDLGPKACAGRPFATRFEFNAAATLAAESLGVTWSNRSSAHLGDRFRAELWPDAHEEHSATGATGRVTVNLTLAEPGSYHVRAHAVLEGAHYWSREMNLTIVPEPPPADLSRRFAHEHVAYALVVEGREVSFSDPAYDISRISDRVHLHYRGHPADGNTWHLEGRFPGGVPDLTLADILGVYGVELRPGYLKLDALDGHNGSAWPDAGTKLWRLFAARAGSPFEESADPSSYVPRDLDRLLLTYGDLAPEEVARQQALVPEVRP